MSESENNEYNDRFYIIYIFCYPPLKEDFLFISLPSKIVLEYRTVPVPYRYFECFEKDKKDFFRKKEEKAEQSRNSHLPNYVRKMMTHVQKFVRMEYGMMILFLFLTGIYFFSNTMQCLKIVSFFHRIKKIDFTFLNQGNSLEE